MSYGVLRVEGDYSVRQRMANAAGAICYAEQHLNGATNTNANFALVVVASNASATSRAWGADYVRRVCAEFGTRPGHTANGVDVRGPEGRGYGNLVHTAMPAILCEPMFASNPEQAEMLRRDDTQIKLASILAMSIVHAFPRGGLVALSVGHMGQRSRPHDRGVPLAGLPPETEAAISMRIIDYVHALLRQP